ncbi:MAG: PrsW family glutamic-type intramembrane protease [Planctomycetota bacterium]
MLVYLTLIVCAALLALLVYRYDMYEREPWYMLVAMAVLGAGAMWLVGKAEMLTLQQFSEPWPAPLIAIVASTHEEAARLILVAALALLVPHQFNDPMDGIIYGSIVGLGMAVEESIGNSDLIYPNATFLPPTEIIRLAGHLVLGGITTFAIGMARMRIKRWGLALAGCVAFTLAWHFLWDWMAFAVAEAGSMRRWQTAGAVALMLAGMMVYGMLVVVGSDWSGRIFQPHTPRELWGWPFDLIVGKIGTKRRAAASESD